VDTFLQQVINGLTAGSVYAVVALGYTMVYGIIGLINFAHGALLTVATSSPAPAGPKSIAPVPAHARCDRKQVLRSRAFARSLRMTTPRGFRKRIEREGGVGAQHAAPLQFCLTPTKASDLELVSCLNSIKGSYRAELRDLFEAHFGRFEEKLERRLADLRVELHSTKADMLKWSVGLWVPVTLAVIGLYFKR